MSADLVTIRDELFNRIEGKRLAAGFIINDFSTEKTWSPRERLEDLQADHPGGKVYLIGLAADDTENRSRSNLTTREIPIMVGYQRANVDPTDTPLIDRLVELEEQLRDVCRNDVAEDLLFSWMRNESLKDENGTAMSFVGLREGHMFEAYFTAFYNRVLT